MQSETGFPSSHQLKSYVASKSRLKLAVRAVLSADAGLLVNFENMYAKVNFENKYAKGQKQSNCQFSCADDYLCHRLVGVMFDLIFCLSVSR